MNDKYKELSDVLITIMNLLEEFKKTKDDLKKKEIRPFQIEMLHLSKVISGDILPLADQLSIAVDQYLANPKKDLYEILLKLAVSLKNKLWEL